LETLLLIIHILVVLGVIPIGRRRWWPRGNYGLVQIILFILLIWLIIRLF
jgi:hypothetical protein